MDGKYVHVKKDEEGNIAQNELEVSVRYGMVNKSWKFVATTNWDWLLFENYQAYGTIK